MVDDLTSESPPSKRRRTGTGHAAPSPASIASSNAHLQFLNQRQNRRLQRWTDHPPPPTTNAPRPDLASPSSAAPAHNRPSESESAEALAQTLFTSAPAVQSLASGPSSSNAPAQATPHEQEQEQEQERSGSVTRVVHASPTVSYEAPSYTDGGLGMPAPTTNTRKSLDTAATARSLPSPAPSDENTNSPTFGEGQLPSRRGRPLSTSRSYTQGFAPANPMSMPMPRTRPSGPTMPEQLMYTGYAQQDQIPRNIADVHLQQGSMMSPQLHRNPSHSRPNSIHILPSNRPGQPSTQPQQPPPLISPGSHGQPAGNVVFTASRLPVPMLLNSLDAQRELLSRTGQLQSTDSGRIQLLRDSVVRQDWFYQMLSQVFCIHSTAPDMLPHVLHQVTPQSFTIVGSLLCSNDKVNPALVKFCSNFPEPIMTIYSDTSNAREVYDGRLRSIAIFLQKLPIHWDRLVANCKQMMAPPLVQDLVETLNMKSEVLQTTVFRAITRMFWGVEDNPGMKVVEEVHLIDQRTYYDHGYRRDQQGKQMASRMMAFVLQQWQSYREVNGLGDHLNNFTMPFAVREFFGKRPRLNAPASSQIAASSQTQQIRQIQNQHQHQHQSQQIARQAPQQARPQSQRQPSLQAQLQARLQAQNQLQSQRGPQISLDMARVAQFNQQGINSPGSMNMPLMSPSSMLQSTPTTPGGRSKRIYPPENSGQRAQPTHPNPDIAALHQSHLRSPKLQSQAASINSEPPVLYRHVVGYGLTPTRVQNSTPMQTFDFAISPSTMARVARSEKSATPGEPALRTVNESSLLYRLRCCEIPPDGYTDESSWVTSDNFWPDSMSFSLNNIQLETRRKLHHGRYLPIDVTDMVKQDTNTLRIALNRKDGFKPKGRYAVAIEAVGISTHPTITSTLTRVSAAASLAAIQKSLAGANADDDIAVTSSSTIIKLTDPHSLSDLIVTPVRGSGCLHRDCFDLDTFLRLCRRSDPESGTTVVDCWRCPLCRGDVRPQMLVLDEFLVGVRDELVKRGLTDTRAIQVQADGTWRPKTEDATGVRSASLEREEQMLARKKTAVIEIIELD